MAKDTPSLDLRSPMQKEVTIKFKPVVILIVLGVLLVLLGVFFAGRWSVSATCTDVDNSQEENSLPLAVQEETQEQVVESQEEAVQNETSSEQEESSVTPQEVDQEAQEDASLKVQADPTSQELITSYENVDLSITNVGFSDKGDWGKINDISITIHNDEVGRIEPVSFEMTLEGYDDMSKGGTLSTGLLFINAGESKDGKAFLSKSFSYAHSTFEENNIDPSRVSLTIVIKDGAGKTMASTTKSVSLG